MCKFALEHIFNFLIIKTCSSCNYIDPAINTPTLPTGAVCKIAVNESFLNRMQRLETNQ